MGLDVMPITTGGTIVVYTGNDGDAANRTWVRAQVLESEEMMTIEKILEIDKHLMDA